MLINGKWQEAWQPHDGGATDGTFVRKPSSFRHWVTPDGSAGPSGDGDFPAEAGRYHLYVASAESPAPHRTLRWPRSSGQVGGEVKRKRWAVTLLPALIRK